MKKLLDKCKEFDKIRDELKNFGANDSEPNNFFFDVLKNKLCFDKVIEINNSDWQLYDMPGSKKAAVKLSKKMKTLQNACNKATLIDVNEVIKWYGLKLYY